MLCEFGIITLSKQTEVKDMTFTKEAVRDRALKIMVNVRAPLAAELKRLSMIEAMRVGKFRSVAEKKALNDIRNQVARVDRILSKLSARFAEAA
jgi:hypothetical protein